MRSGFTLVELSLALFVVAIGLMAALALLPAGVDAGRAQGDDIRAALFAGDVFDFYEAAALEGPWPKWASIPPPAPSWWDAFDPPLTPNGPDPVRLAFRPSAALYAAGLEPSDAERPDEHVLRARLTIQPHPTSPSFIQCLKLRVWPGEFGPADDEHATIFYTEIYRFGAR